MSGKEMDFMKRLLAFCIALITMVSLFAGCADKTATGSTEPNADSGTSQDAASVGSEAPKPDPVLTPVDMGGYELVVADEFQGLWHQEPNQSDHGDAVMERVNYVREAYNCKVTYKGVSPNDMYNQVRTKALSGEKSFDAVVATTWVMGQMMPEKLLEPLNTVEGLHLDASYWSKNITNVGTFGGKTFFSLPTFFMADWGGMVMFFNKEMLEENNLENPWTYVDKGEWTWDKFKEMGLAVARDINGDNKIGLEDRAGFVASDVYGDFSFYTYLSAVEKIIDEEDGSAKITMNNERSVKILNKINDMVNVSKFISFNPKNAISVSEELKRQFMGDNQALFYMASAGYGKEFGRSGEFDFGMVPLPSLEKGEKNYAPLTHNVRVMAMPIKNPNKDKAAILLNALASRGQKEIDVQVAEYVEMEYIADERSMQFYKEIEKYALYNKAGVFFNETYRKVLEGTRGVIETVVKDNKEFVSTFETSYSAAEKELKDGWKKIVG